MEPHRPITCLYIFFTCMTSDGESLDGAREQEIRHLPQEIPMEENKSSEDALSKASEKLHYEIYFVGVSSILRDCSMRINSRCSEAGLIAHNFFKAQNQAIRRHRARKVIGETCKRINSLMKFTLVVHSKKRFPKM